MKTKRYFGLIIILILAFILIAARPNQEITTTWQDMLKMGIILLTAALGAPVTQFFKNVFKIEDRLALILTGVLASGFAILELWLSHILDFSQITVDNFPQAFTLVFTVATVYYVWFKDGASFLGRGFLLKKPKI